MSYVISLKCIPDVSGLTGSAVIWLKVDGNKQQNIGNSSGFSLILKSDCKLDPADDPVCVEYKLIAPFKDPMSEMERLDIFLLRRGYDSVRLLGRVSISSFNKVADWAENLINRDLEHSGLSPNQDDTGRHGEQILKQIEEVAASGLDKVYLSHEHFLNDFCAGFPWVEPERRFVQQWILQQPRFKAASDVIEARGGPSYFQFLTEMSDPKLADQHEAEVDRNYLVKRDPRWGTKL